MIKNIKKYIIPIACILSFFIILANSILFNIFIKIFPIILFITPFFFIQTILNYFRPKKKKVSLHSESIFQKRLKRFKSIKRGYYSLYILLVFYIISLIGPLWMNDKPLMIAFKNGKYDIGEKYEDINKNGRFDQGIDSFLDEKKYYFPAVKEFLGLNSDYPAKDFNQKIDGSLMVDYRLLNETLSMEDSDNYIIMPLYDFSPNRLYENLDDKYIDANNNGYYDYGCGTLLELKLESKNRDNIKQLSNIQVLDDKRISSNFTYFNESANNLNDGCDLPSNNLHLYKLSKRVEPLPLLNDSKSPIDQDGNGIPDSTYIESFALFYNTEKDISGFGFNIEGAKIHSIKGVDSKKNNFEILSCTENNLPQIFECGTDDISIKGTDKYKEEDKEDYCFIGDCTCNTNIIDGFKLKQNVKNLCSNNYTKTELDRARLYQNKNWAKDYTINEEAWIAVQQLKPSNTKINSANNINKSSSIIGYSFKESLIPSQKELLTYDSNKNNKWDEDSPPSTPGGNHIFGIDTSGRDVFTRLIDGYKISITFAIIVSTLGYIIGIIVGALLGYYGGRWDLFGVRLIEIFSSVPFLFVLMILAGFMKPSLLILAILSVILKGWIGITMYIRGEFFREKPKDYVSAAVSMGQSNWKIMFKHILPNSLTPIITFAPFSIIADIGTLVSLDFLGYGLDPKISSWGQLLRQGSENLQEYHLLIFPVIALTLTIFMITFISEAIREAFDPRVYSRLK
mgnify:CR=1 FL=1|tara:strand:+ start:1320 stop:3533 length:2214 start_codon:yes stop_codon:yes gene_type:complete